MSLQLCPHGPLLGLGGGLAGVSSAQLYGPVEFMGSLLSVLAGWTMEKLVSFSAAETRWTEQRR